MAPNGEMLGNAFSRSDFMMKPLQRAISDLSLEMNKEAVDIISLPPISEVEDAKCECCGMSEECTLEYIAHVRERFFGKWICGLCSEAVKAEVEKNGGRQEEALHAHMSACVRFNRFGRTHPVLYQAEAMREILRKSSRGARAKSSSPRDKGSVKKGGIARSSSCIPAITKEIQEQTAVN